MNEINALSILSLLNKVEIVDTKFEKLNQIDNFNILTYRVNY